MTKGFKKTKAPTKGQLIENQGSQLEQFGQQNKALMQSLMQVHQNMKSLNDEIGALSQLLRMDEVNDLAQKGDAVMIDFIGFLYKEDGSLEKFPFQGGHNQGHVLMYLGGGRLLPEFEAAIEGKKAGESFELDFTFPEEYQVADLKNKKTKFTIQIVKVWRRSVDFKVKAIYDALVAEAQEEARKKQEAVKKAAAKVDKAAEEVKKSINSAKKEESSEQ